MTAPRCLIISYPDDPHTEVVSNALRARMVPALCFDPSSDRRVPRMAFEPDGGRLLLEADGECVDLAEVRTVWLRRPQRFSPVALTVSASMRARAAVLRALWAALRDRFWVNPLWADAAAGRKPYQLEVAREVGFEIPSTLITNDSRDARDFFAACGGRMVYKTLEPTSRARGGERSGIHTSTVSRHDLERLGDSICLAPCIFQELIEDGTDVRVTVMNDRVFANTITVRDRNPARPDWRRDPANASFEPYALDSSVEEKVCRLLERLGLVFGCLDFIRAADGRMMFLELNPAGQWYWVEQRTGLPLLNTFAELLASGPSAGRQLRPAAAPGTPSPP